MNEWIALGLGVLVWYCVTKHLIIKGRLPTTDLPPKPQVLIDG